MGFTLNLTEAEIKNAQGGSIPALPAGVYGAVIFEVAEKVSKAGNPMYEIDFKITEGAEGIGRKVRGWYTIKPDALFAYVNLAKATGKPYPSKDSPAGEFHFPDGDEFLGDEVNIKISQEPYQTEDDNGEVVTAYRNSVKKVFEYDPDKIDGAEEVASSGNFL